jgi:hypothetical protein
VPADEDVSIGLVVVVVPQLSFAGCANVIVGIQINRNAKKKMRIGDRNLIAAFLMFSLFKQVVGRVEVAAVVRLTFLKELSNENITNSKEIRAAEKA